MVITNGKCVACGACISACPQKCITMIEGERGFWIPQIDSEACIQCKRCQMVCPVNSRPKGVSWEEGDYFAIWANDTEQRKEGSSGGVFGLLADEVLEKGGIVYGAAYSKNCKYVYQTNTDQVSLQQLKKSKYVESYTGDVFSNVKSQLEKGRNVLFCGTSCQIDGLVSYLNREYDNLLTCDFLCHGVPAASVFRKYIESLEARYGMVTHVDFRSKTYGWKTYCSKVEFASGNTYLRTKLLDPYLRSFFEDFVLRDACYECRRLHHSNADITLGDWWRVTNYPEVPDTDEGISLVGIHTMKGWEQIKQIIADRKCVSKHLERSQYEYAYQMTRNMPPQRETELLKILSLDDLFSIPVPLNTLIHGVAYHLKALIKTKLK